MGKDRQTSRKPGAAGPDPSSLAYEAAVEELEGIIERIEAGEIGLEESLAQYERGAALLRRCREILAQAEQRVTELTPVVDPEAKPAGRGQGRGKESAGRGGEDDESD